MTKNEFIATIAPMAIEDMIQTGVLASITIAQAALESAWGESAPGNNLFGIKATGDEPQSEQVTKECYNGEWLTVRDGFRAYESWYGSIVDHSAFLLENGRYAAAGFFDRCAALDFQGAASALQAAGYATDPDYANKLITIIANNQLYQYDKEAEKTMKVIEELQAQVEELKGQYQTLLNTAEAHIEEINALKAKASMSVPDWAQEAVNAAVAAGLIDTPDGGSYDFYRVLTVFHRKGLI